MSAVIARNAAVFNGEEKLLLLSSQNPAVNLAKVPDNAAKQKPTPICVAVKDKLLNTRAVK